MSCFVFTDSDSYERRFYLTLVLNTMIKNKESTEKIKKFIIDNPDALLLDSVIINALEYASQEIIIFLLQSDMLIPNHCSFLPDRLELLSAAGINVCWEGCSKHTKWSHCFIQKTAFNAVKIRLMQVLIALQDLEFDANRLMHIVYFDGMPFTPQIPLHILWKLVVTVKHFHDRRFKALDDFFKKKRSKKSKIKI